MRYGNVEIKKQTQIFVTVSYYFRMQVIRYMETDKEHTFWTDGYFVCSVGNVSEEMPRKYIENQG